MIDFLDPLELNQFQALLKWRSRFHLFLSDTVPGFRLSRDRALVIPDLGQWCSTVFCQL